MTHVRKKWLNRVRVSMSVSDRATTEYCKVLDTCHLRTIRCVYLRTLKCIILCVTGSYISSETCHRFTGTRLELWSPNATFQDQGVWNRILLSGISKEGSRKRTKSGCLVLDLVPHIYNSPAISQLVAPSRIELLSKV